MPYQIEITLPISKKKVILEQPQWGVQEEVNRYAKANELDGTGATMFLMTKVVIVDGKKTMNPDDFKAWPYLDFMHAVECFNAWKGEPVGEEKAKNELPTEK